MLEDHWIDDSIQSTTTSYHALCRRNEAIAFRCQSREYAALSVQVNEICILLHGTWKMSLSLTAFRDMVKVRATTLHSSLTSVYGCLTATCWGLLYKASALFTYTHRFQVIIWGYQYHGFTMLQSFPLFASTALTLLVALTLVPAQELGKFISFAQTPING